MDIKGQTEGYTEEQYFDKILEFGKTYFSDDDKTMPRNILPRFSCMCATILSSRLVSQNHIWNLVYPHSFVMLWLSED